MAAIVQYYLDPVNPDGQFRQASFEDIESHYQSTFGDLDLVANDHWLKIAVVDDYERHEAYQFNFTCNNVNPFEVYGWDEAGDKYKKDIIISSTRANGVTFKVNGGAAVHHLTFNCPHNAITCHTTSSSAYAIVYNCILRGGGSGYGISLTSYIYIHNNIIELFASGIQTQYNIYHRYITNNTIVKCSYGFNFAVSAVPVIMFANNALYGNGVNYYNTGNEDNSSYDFARNNAGELNDFIPDTVGGTSIIIDESDFKDYVNGDYHITETSKLNHTHFDYPSGDNVFIFTQFPNTTLQDIDGDDLPQTYNDDNDRWDTGYDYFVIPVTGYKWRIPQSEFSDNQVSVSDTTPLEHIDDMEPDTTLGQISSETNKDTLVIDNGGIVVFENYSNIRGFDIDVVDGEIVFRNTTNQGMQHWGWKKKKITLRPIGKITIRGQKVPVGTAADPDWTGAFGSELDTTGRMGEPAVLFVGQTVETALPYYNLGGREDTIENDSVHGRTFNFDPVTGAISFPDYQPDPTDTIWAYNIMIHSRDGLSPAASDCYGFSTVFNGQVDGECFYNTGNSKFTESTAVRLIDYGHIQPLEVEICSSAALKTFRGNGAVAPVNTESVLSKLTGAALGEVHSLSPAGVILRGLRGCTLDKLDVEMLTDAPAVIIGGVAAGNDDITISELNQIGGGVKIGYAISIGIQIDALNHSNDIDAANGRNTQHIIETDTYGFRNLTVSAINLVGFGTAKTLLQFYNAGNFSIANIDYDAAVNSLLYLSSCFGGFVSGAVVKKYAAQMMIAENGTQGITVQNTYCTEQNEAPVAFDEYNGCSDITFRNTATQDSDRYQGWQTYVTDLNFMELNLNNGAGHNGVLVFNFSRSSQGVFTLTGSARSNQTDGVMLPLAGDSVEIEFPYDIKTGSSHLSFFQDVEPTIIGDSVENLSVEYSIDGGTYKPLTAADLAAETFPENGEFRIRLRITCIADGANVIQQVIISTNPDVTVQYPVDLVDITLQNVQPGSRYRVYNVTTGTEIATGEQSGTGDIVISSVPYNGTDELLRVIVRKSSSSPYYKPFETNAYLTSTGATVYVAQEPDAVAEGG